MDKTRLFLSSTCYDLKAVRAHLREKIEELGHEVLASEFNTFPVDSGISTIENCKRVVRDCADILVLIIGGRRGNDDPSISRSIVNAEYLEARERGIDVFVFVDKTVWDLMPIFNKNPDADFSPTVDHSDVFRFIDNVKRDGNWIYQFNNADEIISIIRGRLSNYLRMLIERKRNGTLIIPREFVYESQDVLALIQDRPPFWEYLLTCLLIDKRVHLATARLEDVERGLECRPVESYEDYDDVFRKIINYITDIQNMISSIAPLYERVNQAWGAPGVAGNPIEIYNAIGRMTSLMDRLIDWEIRVKYIIVPDIFCPLCNALRGSTMEIFNVFSSLSFELRKAVELARVDEGPRKVTITSVIQNIPTMNKINREVDIIKYKLKNGMV